MPAESVWGQCLRHLESELSQQQLNTWIRPLEADERAQEVVLFAPNQFVVDWVKDRYLERIRQLCNGASEVDSFEVRLAVGSREPVVAPTGGGRVELGTENRENTRTNAPAKRPAAQAFNARCGLKTEFTFETFVEGKSNQLARAASVQVADNPGYAYNPLFISGGVGLGKTHLMHAVGNKIRADKPGANVVYLHSERFVQDMVRALQHNKINEFKRFYRSVDALLIDDIQFFENKERSQEEFFHTFNALLEEQQQIVMTCDRYPKEVEGVEERLKSRFGWGLTVAIEPPELETRVAILMSKAQQEACELPDEVAFFIAKCFASNVRELEGALHRVAANAAFTGRPITLDFAKEALNDLIGVRERKINIDNIKKTTAEYFKIRVADLVSKRRNRTVTRPRQIGMALSKELTSHSLPEIGDAFGGRDHTTVLHACRKVAELRRVDGRFNDDYVNLLRILTA